nr:hypothetical protein [Tanacetum cinerariifolium]
MDNIGKPTLSGLVSKIRNIDGKPLRSSIRNVKPSIVNEGDTLHGVAEAATVNKSPNTVSFDDNIRVSLINPNEQPNHTKSSDVNKESSRVSFVNSATVVNASPSFSIGENHKPASLTNLETFWEPSSLIGINTNLSQSLGVSSSLPPVNNNVKATGTFATVVQKMSSKKVVKVQEMRNKEMVDGAAVAIPLEAVEAISSRFENTLYGYCIGKRLAFLLFNTKEGMERVLEEGPWMIRREPLMLNVWSQTTDLKKAKIKKALVGKPITLDSYTSNMCVSSWGRSTYAQVLIEVLAENELKDELVVAIPVGKDMGHTLATISIEYEWKPPRCSTCLVFAHTSDKCPTLPKETPVAPSENDGFQVDKSSKKDDSKTTNEPTGSTRSADKSNISVSNSFNVLENEEEDTLGDTVLSSTVNESDSEDVDEKLLVARNGKVISNVPGASTPINERRSLWKSLCKHKLYVRDRAWTILGDFNASLYLDDSTASGSSVDIAMRDFRDCVEYIEVIDIQRFGLQFTWSQNPKGSHGILKKLDRIMANLKFQDDFVGAHAIFKPYRISDHSPAVFCIPTLCRTKPRPFKF